MIERLSVLHSAPHPKTIVTSACNPCSPAWCGPKQSAPALFGIARLAAFLESIVSREIVIVTGERFGMLTVVEPMERRTKSKGLRWLCRCECGSLTVVDSTNLQSGGTLSCGCARPDPPRARSRVEIGDVFGRLTVLEEMLKREPNNARRWLCRCECGALKVVRAGHLNGGKTQSCGCSRWKENKE